MVDNLALTHRPAVGGCALGFAGRCRQRVLEAITYFSKKSGNV